MERRKEGRIQEGRKERKEVEKPSLPSGETLIVALFSSEWKSSKGGLSTINRELAIELAKHLNVEVYVYVPKCSEEDKKVARSHSVQLIETEKLPSFEQIDWLTSLPKGHRPPCLIGHGLHLGEQIPLIKEHHDCKWIQVVHTAPEELGMYKRYEEAIFKGEQKHRAEIKLCELADQVVAVGPKLAVAYARYLRFCGKDQDVINLTPSIFTEFLSVKQATEERRTFCILVFGRIDGEDFKLKGYDIAVQAVAKLEDSSYHLMFVGALTGKEDEVAEKLLQHGIHPSQLTVRRFKESREELAKLFCEVDLAIMPSRTEGFGLTALEALSAGLPVLVSRNSGLGDALKKVPSGFSHVVDSEDPKDWAKAIKIVRQKGREVRLKEANLLREQYALKYSWQKQCDCLVEKMLHLSFGNIHDKLEREEQSQVENANEKIDNLGKLKETSQEADKLQQMESEIANMSEKLHTLMAQRKTEDEDKTRDDFKEMNREIRTISKKLKSQMTPGEKESNRDNLEQMRKEIADIKEKLDTLMNRLPVEEKKLRMEVFNEEVLKQVKEEKGNITDKLGQVEERTRVDLKEMKMELKAISEKLKCQMTTGEEGKEENNRDNLAERMKKQISDLKETLNTLMSRLGLEETKQRMEVDELVIRNAAIKLEADYKECVRVLPYLQNGEVEIHVYFYSDNSGIPRGLNNAAQALFGQNGWKLKWKDLYNNAFNLLKVTPIRYSSGKPKRLETSQVDEIDEIINKHLHDFCKHRNVTAVHPSFKVTNSEETQEACIAVYVLGKGQIPLGESPIPCVIGSYPVDVVNGFFVGTNDPYMPKEAHEQEEFLRLGASIGVKGKQSSGTLGAIVEDENTGTLYALSCNHVLNDDDEKEIIHPGLDVYLNYLRYNLNNYKGEIAIVLGSTGELPQFSDDVREASKLNTMFSNLKAIKEENGTSIESGASKYTKRLLRTSEEKLEKAFVEPPRTIAKYLVGVTSNVKMTNGKEHFIDVAIAKLKEDEVRALKDEKKVRIIDTPHYPSSKYLPATAEVNFLFKSGSATGLTQTNCLADEVHNRPTYIRGGGRGNWIDVGCFPCNKGSEPAQSARCELCRPHGWFKRCLCIPDKEGQPFSREGDSGAVIFEKREDTLSSSGFAIVFGKLDTTHHAFAVASPLQFALEELSRKVEYLNSEACKLKLASDFKPSICAKAANPDLIGETRLSIP